MAIVLNVDDNLVSRHARSTVLRNAGYEVLEATNGHDALAMVSRERPAVVLLDVNLPDISGLEVCKKIKSNPLAAATPVLHISATAVAEEDLITGLQAADAYVTEPVQADVLIAFVAALVRGSELLRQWVAVFDALSDGVALLSGEGKIIRCNSAFCRLLGKRIGEALGKQIDEVMAQAQCGRDEFPFPRSLRTRQSESTECPFGEKMYRISSHLAVVRGSVAGAICIVTDVTEERRAAQEKEEALALLRTVTDSAPVGFAFFDGEGRFRLVNTELARNHNKPVESHIQHTAEEVVPERAGEIRQLIDRVMETGQPVLNHEYSTPEEDGKQVRSWAETWYPVRSPDGRLTGVGATMVETTEKKRADQERQELEKRILDAQKLESIGLLAGGIAHDFNNLLTGILGNAGLAQEMAIPGTPVAGCLEEIVKASERAAHLTKQMLAYSGKGQFFVETVDLSEQTEDVLGLVRASISKKILVKTDFTNGIPKIRADKGQLQQVVMNILVNASEAIGDKAGLMIVKTGVRELLQQEIRETLPGTEIEPGSYAFVEVTDTGTGMDEATKDRIFDPFFTTKFTGRGLGLAAVSGIMRSHGGTIRVKSAPGRGSTFSVYFPFVTEDVPASTPAKQEDQKSQLRLGGAVLVVDDEQIVLRTARSALERLGCRVLVAESGPAAIELFEKHAQEISLVILDLSMAGMSGLEVLPELRRIRSDVPVVISSGYSESETLGLFAGQKISGFLQKPYTPQRLLERVATAVG